MNPLLLPVGMLYFVISGALFVFGINFIYLSLRTLVESRRLQPVPNMDSWPKVTVQLPIYNEMYVAERVIDAAVRLNYPPELLQIQVLDDSTDETSDLIRRIVSRYQEQGINIVHEQRIVRSGFKAGALQAAMATATGDFLAIFDADFVPAPSFLREALPYLNEPDVAFVQARWGHLNRDYSWLTYLQSLAIDAHFMVEQFARSRAGYWFNFNGTAGIWRRTALEDAGGWKADTLTEDLDLSYRAYLRGWRGQYVRDIVVPAELPVSFSAYRKQQHRWARGSLECALKLGPSVWRAPVPLSHKFQATLHLTGYSVHLMIFALTLIYPLVALFSAEYLRFSTLYGFAYIFALTSLAPALFFIIGQHQLGRPWWRYIAKILAIAVVGSGLMINTLRAAWQIVRRRENIFERTAKYGIDKREQDWTKQRYQLRFDPIVYVELILGLYGLFTVWLAVGLESWGIALYALLFGSGLIFAALVTITQTTAVYRSRKARAVRRQRDRQWAIGRSTPKLGETSQS